MERQRPSTSDGKKFGSAKRQGFGGSGVDGPGFWSSPGKIVQCGPLQKRVGTGTAPSHWKSRCYFLHGRGSLRNSSDVMAAPHGPYIMLDGCRLATPETDDDDEHLFLFSVSGTLVPDKGPGVGGGVPCEEVFSCESEQDLFMWLENLRSVLHGECQ